MKFLLKILGLLLKLRYKIQITGLEKIKPDTPQLIFPSHIALIDPIILFSLLSPITKVHPVVTSSYAEKPLLKPLFKALGAVSIGDFEADQGSKENIDEVLKNLTEQLDQKQSILLYPQGALARQGFQVIRGKKTAYYLTQKAPKGTQIFTISIAGLRGSRSSFARNGKSPNLFLFLLKGIFFTLINLIFFIPKRKVTITIENKTKDLQKKAKEGIDGFNTELEKIYNAGGEEKLQYLSGSCLINTVKNHKKPEKIVGSLDDLESTVDFSKEKINEEIFQFVKNKIKVIKPDFSGEITVNSNVVLDLFFDSLDVAELKTSVSTEFPKSINVPLSHLKCVGDFVLMAMGKGNQEEELKPCEWKYQLLEYSDLYAFLKEHIDQKENLLELMKEAFSSFRKSKSSFCYDQVFGVQSFDDFLVKVYLVADLLKKEVSGKYVAIMLPSLSITAILICACYFAEKIPVMLNWTQSEPAFDACVKNQKVSAIFTVKSFYQKLQSPWLKKYHFVFFEDLLKNVGIFTKIKALIKSKFFFLPKKLDQTAVILFTSGSESLPKAVPLTHENLMQDLYAVLGIVRAKYSDILLGALPPFHSFGFTITTILPLITGMRIVFSPDPTDAQQLVSVIQKSQASFLPFTPTFLKGVLNTAKDDQISSLNIAVVGAEKASEEVFQTFAKKCPKGVILEGYGITECSPVIAVNPYGIKKKTKKGSVGFPVENAEIFIGDLKTGEKIGPEKEGMIYVSGKFVFNGYMDKKLESPFITIKKKKYYKTGDLGYFDDEGYLFISGRLKRFVKIAGEMISLPAIEQILFEKYQDQEIPLSVEAKELDNGKAKFVLFSTKQFDLKEINETLYQGGIPHLVEIQEMKVLEEIPLLGTGKTDFMKLRNMIEG